MQNNRNIKYLWMLLLAMFSLPAGASIPVFDSAKRQIIESLPAVPGTEARENEALDGKPVLVTFFASWCPPCREEFAHLNKLAQKYQATDLRIIAINVYEAWDENDEVRMQKFIATTQPVFPAVTGSESVRELFGGIDRIPTVYGFHRDGKPGYRFIHKRGAKKTNASYDELDRAARHLLSPNP